MLGLSPQVLLERYLVVTVAMAVFVVLDGSIALREIAVGLALIAVVVTPAYAFPALVSFSFGALLMRYVYVAAVICALVMLDGNVDGGELPLVGALVAVLGAPMFAVYDGVVWLFHRYMPGFVYRRWFVAAVAVGMMIDVLAISHAAREEPEAGWAVLAMFLVPWILVGAVACMVVETVATRGKSPETTGQTS